MTRTAIGQLSPAVLAMESHGFSLGNDLAHMAAVLDVDAPEATIFYGGRILEALSGAAVEAAGGSAKPNPFANLTYLQEATLLHRDQAYWAHGLRRLGNAVRHLSRPISQDEAEVAALLAERWIEWYFRDFEGGPRFPTIAADPQMVEVELFTLEDPTLAQLLRTIDRPGGEEELAARSLSDSELAALIRAPTAACILAEKWIERRRIEAARGLIGALQPQLGDELRFLQLAALLANRTGDFERTIELLQPKVSEGLQDEETIGILAGGYKRRADSRGSKADLQKSFELYRRGFKTGKEASYYLGINAATTAFLLDRKEDSETIAAKVAAIIEGQVAAVAGLGRDLLKQSYWLAATLAEARLLAGDLVAARQSYADAFAAFERESGNFGTTIDQALAIIRARGDRPEEFTALFERVRPTGGSG